MRVEEEGTVGNILGRSDSGTKRLDPRTAEEREQKSYKRGMTYDDERIRKKPEG
jgi:hypothetical protein